VLEHFALQTFAGHVDEDFVATPPEGGPVTLCLVEASALGDAPNAQTRAPFSIIFRGPRDPALAQGIHRLEHGSIGTFELFLVPIQPEADGPRYQAVFA
jgi:hypothetical protein